MKIAYEITGLKLSIDGEIPSEVAELLVAVAALAKIEVDKLLKAAEAAK